MDNILVINANEYLVDGIRDGKGNSAKKILKPGKKY